MIDLGPIGASAIGEAPTQLQNSTNAVALSVSTLIIPEKSLVVAEQKVAEGRLVSSTSIIWTEIVNRLAADWSLAQQLTPRQWEEMVAGAFKNAGYDKVTLTPPSGDYGRDVIAEKNGVGCVKILGSVKAYAPGKLVPYDAIRALVGVINTDHSVSKGIITTTSDFPPNVEQDPSIAPHLPTRLELMNGKRLQEWLTSLTSSSSS